MVSTAFVLMVAYATSCMRFPARKPLMNAAVIVNLFPGVLSMIAVYFILKTLNLTNTHLGLILVYSAGSGPVKGFALTLGIGIALSMFTSLVVARWVLLLLYHLGCNKEKMYGIHKERASVNFVSKRKIFISISALVIATGVAFATINGVKGNGSFNFDLEFSGGTSTTVNFDKEYTLDEVEKEIIPEIKKATGLSTVQQQAVKGTNQGIF